MMLHDVADTPTVTYGGVNVPQVARINGVDAHAGIAASGYVLGKGVPTGTQTVATANAGTAGAFLDTYTVTSSSVDTEFLDDALLASASVANPSVNATLTSRTAFVALSFVSQHASAANTTPFANWTSRNEDTSLGVVAGTYSYNTISTADVACGLTQTATDYTQVAIAITEVTATSSVAHDGTSNLSASLNNVTSATMSAKTTDGSHRASVIAVGWWATETVSSVTYGGFATGVTQRVTLTAGNASSRQYTRIAPSTSAADITVTFASAADAAIGCSSYNGVEQGTPFRAGTDDTNSGGASAPTLTVATSSTDDIVVDAVFGDLAAMTAGDGQTEVFDVIGTASHRLAGSYQTGAASVVMDWTPSATSAWSSTGLSLQAETAGSSSVSPSVSLSESPSPSPSGGAATFVVFTRTVLDYGDFD